MTSSLCGKVEKVEVSMTEAMIFPLIREMDNRSAFPDFHVQQLQAYTGACSYNAHQCTPIQSDQPG